MSYEVKLEVFEGPLDLLLHLIHRNEVSITDIPIAMITGQYLEAVELMKSLNLDVAGEYLVMAAYLAHIKSLLLLPSVEDPEARPEAPDPRDELVAHLLEYKRYKEAARNLDGMPILDRDVFLHDSSDEFPDLPKAHQCLKVSLTDLLDAFRGVLERTSRLDLLQVEPDRLLVKDKINELLALLKEHEWLTFDSLFQRDASRLHLVTTFLALLELIKLQAVKAYQDEPYGTILISGTGTGSALDAPDVSPHPDT